MPRQPKVTTKPTRWTIWDKDQCDYLIVEARNEGAGPYLQMTMGCDLWLLEAHADIDALAEALHAMLEAAGEPRANQ